MEMHDYINKITEKVFLGCVEGAKDEEFLKKVGVTNILTCLNSCNDHKVKSIEQKVIEIVDEETVKIIRYFKEAICYIENAIGKVYVHCWAGVSRSATIVIAYLMWKNKLSYNEAYWSVKNKRKFISPNEGFVKQLKDFERILSENEWKLEYID
jgi:dual specificity MAP kinase phosphatase